MTVPGDTFSLVFAVGATCATASLLLRDFLISRLRHRTNLTLVLRRHNEALAKLLASGSISKADKSRVAIFSDWANDAENARQFLVLVAATFESQKKTLVQNASSDRLLDRETVGLWINVIESALDVASVLAYGNTSTARDILNRMSGYEDVEEESVRIVVTGARTKPWAMQTGLSPA